MIFPQSLRFPPRIAAAMVLCLGFPLIAAADPQPDAYVGKVQPFLAKYCVQCHNQKDPRGELDLGRYRQAADVVASFRRWSHVIEFIRDGEMPPEDALQPAIEERAEVVETLERILLEEARKRAGDPGPVLPRRLSHTEYDLAVRDLTGVDIRPTQDFPADPAAGEGFDNTGEALSMSPSLLRKYLGAAEHVASHLLLKTTGITFAPFPVGSYNERKKLTEQAIIDFYQRHEVPPERYLEAAWRYRYRDAAERDLPIDAWAKRRGLSGKYLARVWETLEQSPNDSGPLGRLGQLWQSLPAPGDSPARPAELRELLRHVQVCQRLFCAPEQQLIRSNAGNWPIAHLDFRSRVAAARDRFDRGQLADRQWLRSEPLRSPKPADGSPARLSLWIEARSATGGTDPDYVLLHRPILSSSGNPPRNEQEAQKQQVVTLRAFLREHAPDVAERLPFGRHPSGDSVDADSLVLAAPAVLEIPFAGDALEQLAGRRLLVECQLDPNRSADGAVLVRQAQEKLPEDAYAAEPMLLVRPEGRAVTQWTADLERFCATFPPGFFYVDRQRGLAAGFHLVEGFFRDDQPLVRSVLDEHQVQQLDQLWRELHFVTRSAETLLRGFVWFERSERHVLHDERFDFLRAEDPRLVEDQMLTRFEKAYLERLGVKLIDGKLEPREPSQQFEMIHGFFQQIRGDLAEHRELLEVAERRALEDLEELARRAWRRPLSDADRRSLRTLYTTFREQGKGVEDALRAVLMTILMSPDYLFHIVDAPPGAGRYPLSDRALASRLSFLLWSSLPDDELLEAAERGDLQDEAKLLEQARRMIRSPKIEAFAREFFGQWLRYRDYLAKDPIHAEAFAGYDQRLRQSMFEEPQRLTTYLIQEDRPVTELLTTDMTFVNQALARHYGGEIARQFEARRASVMAQSPGGGTSVPAEDLWLRVGGLREAGRGGVFGMGVILTKNSSGERTSPVKRGFWTVHHLLGQHFPPPPADVPELPAKETQASKTIRQLLAEHTQNPRCAMCHVHFDSLGLALEGFDPIGRRRSQDLAGRPVDDVARLPGGEVAQGVAGLIDYVDGHRRDDFVRTLCRKFLGYALGRSVLLSDRPLLDQMQRSLEAGDYRFSVLFETVLRSPQFRMQRGRDFAASSLAN